MAKNRNSVEILQPLRPMQLEAQINALIERKLAGIKRGKADGIFEPFFRSKAIATAIRKLETVPQQRKWTHYFERWGCLVCGEKTRPHMSLGMCADCHHKIAGRLRAILRQIQGERPDEPAYTPNRLVDLAQDALRDKPAEIAGALRDELAAIERGEFDGETLRTELRKIVYAE